MCFIIDFNHQKQLVADKDIICYKRSDKYTDNKTFIPEWYCDFVYKLGKRYKTRIHEDDGFISKGFHSYSSTKRFTQFAYRYVECIIPKGSKYYFNPTDMEYVSNQIIIKKNIYMTFEELNKLI